MFLVGINPTQTWTSSETPPFALGTLAADHQGRIYRFVKCDAGGLTGLGYCLLLEPNNIGDMLETTTSAPGNGQGAPVGFGVGAIPGSGYGWVCVYGSAVYVRCAASAAKGTQLNSTATGGVLDDDATAGSEVVNGVSLNTAVGGAEAAQIADICWPSVGRTL